MPYPTPVLIMTSRERIACCEALGIPDGARAREEREQAAQGRILVLGFEPDDVLGAQIVGERRHRGADGRTAVAARPERRASNPVMTDPPDGNRLDPRGPRPRLVARSSPQDLHPRGGFPLLLALHGFGEDGGRLAARLAARRRSVRAPLPRRAVPRRDQGGGGRPRRRLLVPVHRRPARVPARARLRRGLPARRRRLGRAPPPHRRLSHRPPRLQPGRLPRRRRRAPRPRALPRPRRRRVPHQDRVARLRARLRSRLPRAPHPRRSRRAHLPSTASARPTRSSCATASTPPSTCTRAATGSGAISRR